MIIIYSISLQLQQRRILLFPPFPLLSASDINFNPTPFIFVYKYEEIKEIYSSEAAMKYKLKIISEGIIKTKTKIGNFENKKIGNFENKNSPLNESVYKEIKDRTILYRMKK